MKVVHTAPPCKIMGPSLGKLLHMAFSCIILYVAVYLNLSRAEL